MPRASLRAIALLSLSCAIPAITGSCSDSGTQPIGELKPLAGVWDAEVLSVPDPENPLQNLDLVPQGASFTLSILATGQYTAVYDLVLVRGFETGTINVRGDQITLVPVSPPGTPTSGVWTLQGDRLVVDALRELDLDGDGEDELILFHIELLPKPT